MTDEDIKEFSDECVKQLPQYKECPDCHHFWRMAANFCGYCGGILVVVEEK